MGRYYSIQIGPTVPYQPVTFSSQANGVDDPGALQVQFDLFESFYGAPIYTDGGNSTITIEGVALNYLQQAQTFVGQQIVVKAGMSAGYQIVKPQQAGTILAGQIYQAFGNWIGTDMTLDFVVVPSTFTQADPGGFVLNWQKGTSLQDALRQTLSTAYAQTTPSPSIVFQLSGSYAPMPNGHLARYSTLRKLGNAVASMTKAASPNGAGVAIGYKNATNTLLVTDGPPSSASPIQIQFTDLIGQPTWINSNVMQFVTVLRADVQINSTIRMPQGLQNVPGIVTTSLAAFPSSLKYKAAFQDVFYITSVRQIGNFRDANGASWASVFQCVPQGVHV